MSKYEGMQRLADRYISDAGFRAEMSRNPQGAARALGVELDETSLKALSGVGFISDQALAERVSKGYRSFC